MIARIIIALLLTTLMTGCTGFKMGDVLTKASTTVSQQPTATEEIGVAVYKKSINPYLYPELDTELRQISSRVFSRYGWRTTQSTSAPVVVNLTVSNGKYSYPGSFLLFSAGIGTLPAKFEDYHTVEAEIVVNGIAQDHLTYTGSATEYLTFYSPIALMVPGVTHRDSTGQDKIPDELREQIFVQIMEHIAEDIKTKYFSGNHQKLTI